SFYSYVDHLHSHSFPTRRSSDLDEQFRNLALGQPPRIFGDDLHHLSRLARDGDLAWPGQGRPAILALRIGLAIFGHLRLGELAEDRKSTRLNSSHGSISDAVFCL